MALDTRRLYLGEGCSSLFTYCTRMLHLSDVYFGPRGRAPLMKEASSRYAVEVIDGVQLGPDRAT